MSADIPAGHRRGSTDFGREMSAETDVSLAAALREHAGRMARAEAIRYQLAMGLLGFIGGLVVIIPLVLWSAKPPFASAQADAAGSIHGPALVSVPTIAMRDETASGKGSEMSVATARAGSASNDLVEVARRLIRSGDILAARQMLEQPELSQSGQALFMLAETYDPNVLAALGAVSVRAETPMARQYYEAALSQGVVAAAPRLEALE